MTPRPAIGDHDSTTSSAPVPRTTPRLGRSRHPVMMECVTLERRRAEDEPADDRAKQPRPSSALRDHWRLTPRPILRLTQLLVGLALFGISTALVVLAGLGLGPWDVLHQGLSIHTGLAIGTWSIIVGVLVLILWIPIREIPGLGTVANAIVIGAVMNVALVIIPPAHGYPLRIKFLIAGVVLTGVATGLYIGAGLGSGPRDGLMTGIAARGHSLRVVRTAIELIVLAIGWSLGGTVGIGTIVFALGIGPLSHLFIPMFGKMLARPAAPQDL